MATVGVGLIYTLQIGSKSSKWIGFQVLAGLGVGLAFQIPMIVAQSVSELSEVSHAVAITLCKYSLSFILPKLLTASSFPDDEWRILHFSGPVDLRQPVDAPSQNQCSWTRPWGSHRYGSHAISHNASFCIYSRHRTVLHAKLTYCVRFCNRTCRDICTSCLVREMEEDPCQNV